MTSPFQTLGLHPFLIEQLTSEQIPTVAEGAKKGLQLAFHTDIQQQEDHGLSTTINTHADLLSTSTNAEEYRTQYLRQGLGQATVRAAEAELEKVRNNIAAVYHNIEQTRNSKPTTTNTQTNTTVMSNTHNWADGVFSSHTSHLGSLEYLNLRHTAGISFEYLPFSPYPLNEFEEKSRKLHRIFPKHNNVDQIDYCKYMLRFSYYWLMRFNEVPIAIDAEAQDYLRASGPNITVTDMYSDDRDEIIKQLEANIDQAKYLLHDLVGEQQAGKIIQNLQDEMRVLEITKNGQVDEDGILVLDGKSTGLMLVGYAESALRDLHQKGQNDPNDVYEPHINPFSFCHEAVLTPSFAPRYILQGIDDQARLHDVCILVSYEFKGEKQEYDDSQVYDPLDARIGEVIAATVTKTDPSETVTNQEPIPTPKQPPSSSQQSADSSQSQPSEQPDAEPTTKETALTKAKGVQVQYKRNPFEVIGVLPSLLQQLSEDQLKLHIKHLVKSILEATHPESPTPNPELYVEVNLANQQLDNPKTFKQAYEEYKDSKPGEARAKAILELKEKEAKVIPGLVRKLAEEKRIVASYTRNIVGFSTAAKVFMRNLACDLFFHEPHPSDFPSALYLHHAAGTTLSVSTPSGTQQFTIERRAYDVFAVSDSARIRLLGSSLPSFKGTADDLQQIMDAELVGDCYHFAHPIIYPSSHLIGFVEDKDKLQVLGTIEDIRRAKVTARKMRTKDRKPETGNRKPKKRRTK